MLARQAVLVVLSQGVSNDANNHMSYPTKLLFKASKLVPIMLVGRFVFRRRYHALEWLATLLLVGGLYTVVIADAGGSELRRRAAATEGGAEGAAGAIDEASEDLRPMGGLLL